jgi:hypothetical protein
MIVKSSFVNICEERLISNVTVTGEALNGQKTNTHVLMRSTEAFTCFISPHRIITQQQQTSVVANYNKNNKQE